MFHILAHVFARLAEKRKFPVVNDSGSVRRKMRQPTVVHQCDECWCHAVLNCMSAESQHDRAIQCFGFLYLVHCLTDKFKSFFTQILRRHIGRDMVGFNIDLVLPLRKRLQNQFITIEFLIWHNLSDI